MDSDLQSQRLKLLLFGDGGVKVSEREIESEKVEGEMGAEGQAGKENILKKPTTNI